jgi:subtilisin family serine protease
MNLTVKVFCTGPAQDRLAERYRVIERYDGFVLAEVPQKGLRQLSREYPVEDITDLYTIPVGERRIETSRPRLDAKGKLRSHPAYKGVKPLSPGRHHHLVQFIGPIKDAWLKGVKQAGGEPRAPHADFTYVVRADEKTLRRIIALPFVRWAGHLPHLERVAPSVFSRIGRKPSGTASSLLRRQVLPGVYVVEFFGPDDLANALRHLKKVGFRIRGKETKGRILVVEATGLEAQRLRAIEGLAAIHGVRAIREWSLARTSNDVAAGIMGTAMAMGNPGLGLSGKGEYVGVCDTGLDTGDPRTIHPDFAKRVAWIKSYPISPSLAELVENRGADDGPADAHSGHGTHVAGSIVGTGAASRGLKGKGLAGPIRGLAYRAKLVFQAVEQEMKWRRPAFLETIGPYYLAGIPDDLTVLFSEAYRRGVRIHSNSWSKGDPGDYAAHCEQLDRFIWKHKDFCVLVSAGNDGIDPDGHGTIECKSVKSPGTAKNCITVGACENRRPNFNTQTYASWAPTVYPAARFRNDPMADNPARVVPFSGRGPTQDERVKPDVVAPGTFVLSTRSQMIARTNNGWAAFPWSKLYFYMGGTSQATPLTAGAVALVREYLRTKKKIKRPTAALLKAAIIAGATRLPGYAPAGAILDNHQGFGRVNLDAVLSPPRPASSQFVEVKPGLRTGEVHEMQIKVKSGKAPFRVTLAYSDYPGESLVNNLNLIATAPDGARYIGNQPAGKPPTFDARNNVEVVHVQKPGAGAWRIEVVGSNVPHGPQDFALVYTAHV